MTRQILPTSPEDNEPGGRRTAMVGDQVRVRKECWVVADLREFDRCALLTLAGAGMSNPGAELQVLTPFEQIDRIHVTSRLRRVSGRRWRHACRALVASAAGSGSLHSARAARVDLLPFQLEPALAIVRGLASRILIADEVGLGKTIQAGLILSELITRGAATRILVLTPSGLRDQWIDELRSRFTLEPILIDMLEMRRLQSGLPFGVNPWASVPFAVASIDYVKRPDVLLAVQSCHWDAVVIDEAHGIGVSTDRERAAAALCERASYVLLLTATPHNGDPRAFQSLRALGSHGDDLLTFRRTRAAAGLGGQRRIHRLCVRANHDERRMHAGLAAFARALRRERNEQDRDVALALAVLQKRAFSGAHALERSVRRRLATLELPAGPGVQQLLLPLDPESGELDASDDIPAWTLPALDDVGEERALLTRIADAAGVASRHETKLAALRRLLRRVREPVIVFTEYRDTLLHVRQTVTPDAAVIHGGMPRVDRRAALERFARGGLLLATDAAGEGLNLQAGCRVVVNLELPWNPMRLEQRLGRVDRIGQRRTVHAFYLIAAAAGETRMLDRLHARLTVAQAEVGAADPLRTIDQQSGAAAYDTTTAMARAAAAEHARLVRARRFTADEMPTRRDDGGVLLARSRRSSVRTELRSRALILFESVATDRRGHVVASHLTAVTAPFEWRARWTTTQLDAIARSVCDGSLPQWTNESMAHHREFWRRRRDRDQSIADAHEGSPSVAFQPGLFDRRATGAQLLAAAESDRLETTRASLMDAAERSMSLTLHRLRPRLVLVP